MSQADWDRLQYYSRRVKFFKNTNQRDNDPNQPQVHPSTYIRITQLQSSALFPSLRHLEYNLNDGNVSHIFLFLSPLLDMLTFHNIGGFENAIVEPFLATLSSKSQMLTRIFLHSGKISVDNLKNSIVHFKQLRSLEFDCIQVPTSNFALWEVLGTLPSLANLSVKYSKFVSHPMHAPEKSNSQSGGPKYFEVLESLCVTGSGSFFQVFIQHLLGIIDSPCLESIKVSDWQVQVNNELEPEGLITSSMMIIASKWSQSLKILDIYSNWRSMNTPNGNAISKCLALLTVLQEMQTFHLAGWRMENIDDDVRRLLISWPKLRTLGLHYIGNQFISLSTLRIIAENCPGLRDLIIQLDTSTIPPFDTSSKSLCHNLEVLIVRKVRPPSTQTTVTLEHQIQVTRHLDLIFPYLISINVWDEPWKGICDLFKLCQDARRVTT